MLAFFSPCFCCPNSELPVEKKEPEVSAGDFVEGSKAGNHTNSFTPKKVVSCRFIVPQWPEFGLVKLSNSNIMPQTQPFTANKANKNSPLGAHGGSQMGQRNGVFSMSVLIGQVLCIFYIWGEVSHEVLQESKRTMVVPLGWGPLNDQAHIHLI